MSSDVNHGLIFRVVSGCSCRLAGFHEELALVSRLNFVGLVPSVVEGPFSRRDEPTASYPLYRAPTFYRKKNTEFLRTRVKDGSYIFFSFFSR